MNTPVRSRPTTRRAALRWLAACALALGLPGLAFAGSTPCTNATLKGNYVFNATGYTRFAPGTPWVPKAILELLHFDGAGGVTTPMFTVANPVGDTGLIIQGVGAPGTYQINANCTGTLLFADTNGTIFSLQLRGYGGALRMIQVNPLNNVFQGIAVRAH